MTGIGFRQLVCTSEQPTGVPVYDGLKAMAGAV